MEHWATFWNIYLNGWGILLGAMTVLWLLSLYLKNASIVDPVWGSAFVLVGWYYFSQSEEGHPARQWLLMGLVTIWGLRLSLYLLWRNWGHGEDYRYQAFRQRYGPQRYGWISLFQVFWLQATLAWLISSTLLGAQIQGGPLNLLDYLGVGVWLVGFVFEAGGDWQLLRFKANPANKGQLLTTGFWRYTRHPNYFGDAACWWGYGLMALAAGSFLAAVGAVIMTYLLLRVSGVALLERSLTQTKPGYTDYVRRTNAFLPWFPKA